MEPAFWQPECAAAIDNGLARIGEVPTSVRF